MKDQRFVIYKEPGCALFGDVTGGCLHLDSDMDEDDCYPASELHYRFSAEDTQRLFCILSLEELIALCKKKRSDGAEGVFGGTRHPSGNNGDIALFPGKNRMVTAEEIVSPLAAGQADFSVKKPCGAAEKSDKMDLINSPLKRRLRS